MGKVKVVYHDLHDDCPSTQMGGVAFEHNVPVEVDLEDARNDNLIDMAIQNPFFEVQGLPAHNDLMDMRAKRGGRPLKTEIEGAKRVEAARAERDKRLAEAEAAKVKADEAAHKAVTDAQAKEAGAAAAPAAAAKK